MRLLAASLGGLLLLIGAGSGGATTRDEPKIRPVAETISAGYLHTCGVANGISVRCWGRNDKGQLGNGTTDQFGDNPLPRDALGAGSGITDVAAGGDHSCLLGFGGGGIRCWGGNFLGQLGTGDTVDRLQPADVVGLGGSLRAIAAGDAYTCAVRGGGVRCWGVNREGELGNGQAGCDPQEDPFLANCYRKTPVSVSGLGGVRQLSAGSKHACALTTGGGVACWGSNESGQLGNGGPTGIDPETGIPRNANTPVEVRGLGNGAKAVSAGGDHTCAITNAGAIKCWGDNGFGQLGDATTTERHTPVTVARSGAAAIAAGWQHTCAITTKGGVICWGRNTYGGLGDGTKHERHRPVAVHGLGLGSSVTEITAGYQFTCARLEGDDIRCWGRNDFGQLGDGTTASRTKPVTTLFGCFELPPTIVAKPGKVTTGTGGDDVILGTNGPDFIRGKGGSDRICGFGGPDRIHVGGESSRVNGGRGDDDIRGGDEGDQLDGGPGNDSIEGGKGNDAIDAFEPAGDDKLRGDEGDDVLHGGEGVDLLVGGEGSDRLFGDKGSETLDGGPGDDLLSGHDGSDDLDGGAGDDEVLGGDDDDILAGGGGRDELVGNAGDDHISGNGGTDRLYGDSGDDSLFGGDGSDFLFGNPGDDHLLGQDGFDILHGGPGFDLDDGGAGKDHCWGEIFKNCAEVHKPG
jgi:alpha-tubulin suppressor-like RCC1 family protein